MNIIMFKQNIYFKILIILLLGINELLFAQNITSDILKYYEFNLCNSPYTIILTEKNNHKFKGAIITKLFTEKKKGYRDIIKKSKIKSKKVEAIILKLNETKIDSVNENFDDDDAYYLDGDHLVIRILKKEKLEKYIFQSIHSLSTEKIEQTPLRSQLQNWVTIVEEGADLQEVSTKLRKNLSKGRYCYHSGGAYTSCIIIK